MREGRRLWRPSRAGDDQGSAADEGDCAGDQTTQRDEDGGGRVVEDVLDELDERHGVGPFFEFPSDGRVSDVDGV